MVFSVIRILSDSDNLETIDPNDLTHETVKSIYEKEYIILGRSASIGSDVSILLSGAYNKVGSQERGAISFLGDVVLSGTTYFLSGTSFAQNLSLLGGASGSITKLSDGLTSYIAAGENISIFSASNGQIIISAITSSVSSSFTTSFDNQASYIVLNTTSSLDNERVLSQGLGLLLTDGGANGNTTLAINNSIVATTSGSVFIGPVLFNQGLSGSLTKLTDGRDYIAAGRGITIVSASNEQITLTTDLKNDPDFLLAVEPTAPNHDYNFIKTGNKVTQERWIRSNATLIKTIDYTYSGNNLLTEVIKVFANNGSTIIGQINKTWTYPSGQAQYALTRSI